MTKKKDGRHIPNIFMGTGNYDNKHGVGIILNKKWRQRIFDTEHINERGHHRDRVKPPTHQTDECVLPTLGICGPSHRKNCSKRWRRTQKTAKDTYLLLEGTSMQNWNVVTETECTSVGRHPPRGKQKRLLVEKLADATGLHRFQHDVQKNTSETNDHHISER